MLSVIEVTCPHCGAKGQIMLPPVSTLIVGPCPECQGLVVVFCGNVLPLDKDLMLTGVVEEKREHLMSVLSEFLRERIWQMVPEEGEDGPETELPMGTQKSLGIGESSSEDAGEEPPSDPVTPLRFERATANTHAKRPPISDDEMTAFVGSELALLDNPESFRALFG